MAKTYSVGIVGESNYQQAIKGLREGERVYLQPEPDNPHDARAIAVRDGDGATIGYIPREHWLTGALIDEGKGSRALIERIEGGDADRPNLGVVLQVELGAKGAPVAPPAQVSAVARAQSAAERAARNRRLDAALGPAPVNRGYLPQTPEQEERNKKLLKGCGFPAVVVLALMIVIGITADPPAPPTAAEKAKAAADEKAAAAGAKDGVKAWYNELMAVAAVCDVPSKRFADQVQTIGSGGSTFESYQLAKSAESACRDASLKFDDIAVPAGVSSAVEEAIDSTTETCSLAYVGKQMAAADAKEIMDGNMTNSAVSEFQDKVRRATAGQLACVAGAMDAASKAGWTVDEIGKFRGAD